MGISTIKNEVSIEEKSKNTFESIFLAEKRRTKQKGKDIESTKKLGKTSRSPPITVSNT